MDNYAKNWYNTFSGNYCFLRVAMVYYDKELPDYILLILRKIANEGISVEFSYGLENNRYVIGVDNLEKALEAIK